MTELAFVLPSQCVAAEELGRSGSVVGLYPEERAFIAGAGEKRRQEFAAGRRCARRALGMLNAPMVALLPDDGGTPQWPRNVIGSLTHCEGYVGAALAPADQLRGLGIDAEPRSPLPDGVLDFIAVPEERVRVDELTSDQPDMQWARLLFSAKEAVYKTWYPLTGAWLEFEQVRVELEPDHRFSAKVSHPDGLAFGTFRGQWRLAENILLTASFLPVDMSTAS